MVGSPARGAYQPNKSPKSAFDDKIISETMRMILNAIYDPIFEELKSNRGFILTVVHILQFTNFDTQLKA